MKKQVKVRMVELEKKALVEKHEMECEKLLSAIFGEPPAPTALQLGQQPHKSPFILKITV